MQRTSRFLKEYSYKKADGFFGRGCRPPVVSPQRRFGRALPVGFPQALSPVLPHVVYMPRGFPHERHSTPKECKVPSGRWRGRHKGCGRPTATRYERMRRSRSDRASKILMIINSD